MKLHLIFPLVACCFVAHAQTNFTFGPGSGSAVGNVPPPYIATGTWTTGSTPVVPYTPITTDGWGNLSSVGAMLSYGGIGGQGLTISNGGQSLLTFAVQNNATTGTLTNQLACWDGSGSAVNCPATTSSVPAPKVIGLVYLNGGIGGAASIVRAGMAPCLFDTGSTAAVGHYVVPSSSSSTPGYCHDAGAAYPMGYQPVGIVTTLGYSGVNYIFVMDDVLAVSPGTTGNMTVTGGAGLQAIIDIVNNPAFSTSVTSPLYTSPGSGGLAVTAAGGGALNLSTSASTSAATGAVAISSGANSGSGGTGNVTIDVGATTTAPGQVQIGANNASAVSLGNAAATTTVNGPLTASKGLSLGANTNLILPAGTGRAGIGVPSPMYPLDVSGNINSSSGFCIAGSCVSAWPVSSQWSPSGSNIYYAGGNVGIGTNSPSYNLSVVGQSNTTGQLFVMPLATPGAPVVTPTSAQSASYSYEISAQIGLVTTAVSAQGTTMTGNSNLSLYPNTVSWTAVPGATSYNIYRTTGSSPGLIGNTPSLMFSDSGTAGTTAPPTFNATGNVGIGTATPTRLFEAHINAPGLESDFVLQNDDYSVTDAGTGMLFAALDSTGVNQVFLGGMDAYFNDSNSSPSYNGVVSIREQINGYLEGVITLVGGNVGIGISLPAPPLSAPVTLPALLSVGSTSQFQVNSSGLVSSYDNTPTQGLGLSPILASPARLTGKTSSIGATTLCGSATCGAGLYSVQYYLNCSTAGSGGTATLAITWNDGASQSFSASVPLTSTGYAQGQITLYSSGAAAISYSTTVAGAAGSPQYALSLSVPRLQ